MSGQAATQNTPKPRQRLSGEERRDTILDAARALIREQGIEKLTMDRVAARCGINKALPYRHFKNKDDLILTLFKNGETEVSDAVAIAMHGITDYEAATRALVFGWLGVVKEGRSLPSLWQARSNDGAIEALREERVTQILGFVTDLIRSSYDIDAKQAELAAAVLFSGTRGLLALAESTPLDIDELAESFVKMSVGAVEAVSRGKK